MLGCVCVNSRHAVVTASCPHTRAAAGSLSGTLNVRRARAGAQDGWIFHPQHKLAQGRVVAKGEAEGQGCRETLGNFPTCAGKTRPSGHGAF